MSRTIWNASKWWTLLVVALGLLVVSGADADRPDFALVDAERELEDAGIKLDLVSLCQLVLDPQADHHLRETGLVVLRSKRLHEPLRDFYRLLARGKEPHFAQIAARRLAIEEDPVGLEVLRQPLTVGGPSPFRVKAAEALAELGYREGMEVLLEEGRPISWLLSRSLGTEEQHAATMERFVRLARSDPKPELRVGALKSLINACQTPRDPNCLESIRKVESVARERPDLHRSLIGTWRNLESPNASPDREWFFVGD